MVVSTSGCSSRDHRSHFIVRSQWLWKKYLGATHFRTAWKKYLCATLFRTVATNLWFPVEKGTRVLYFPQTALGELTTQHGHETAVSFLGGSEEGHDHNNLTQTEMRMQLGKFGLTKQAALRTAGSLSTGQRARLWLAKQCVHSEDPTLLIMDEMSENLDVQTR
jgi:ATPase subunit of ABC transporter with duplicated ATPase domains